MITDKPAPPAQEQQPVVPDAGAKPPQSAAEARELRRTRGRTQESEKAVVAGLAEARKAAEAAGKDAGLDDDGDAGEGEAKKKTDAEKTDESKKLEAKDPKEAKDGEKKPDPEISDAVAKIQRAKKLADQEIATKRAEVEKQAAELAPVREQLKVYETAKARAKADPVGVLSALGVKPSLELARAIFAASDDAPPEEKARAAQVQKTREAEDAGQQALAAVEKMKADLAREKEEFRIEREVEAYRGELKGGVAAAADADAPLVKRAFAKKPAEVMKRLEHLAARILGETGEVPKPGDVISRYERGLRAELEDIGIDYGAATGAKKSADKANEAKTPAAERDAAKPKTLGNDLSTPTRPRKKPTNRAEADAELLGGLRGIREKAEADR